MSEINVVPYIDVMLVLMVIFMITTPLLTQGVKVDLPNAFSKPIKQPKVEDIVVTVDAKGIFYFDDRKISADTLRTKVKKTLRLQPRTPVYVRGDKKVAYGRIIEVMTILQEAGAPSVGLITQPRNKKPR